MITGSCLREALHRLQQLRVEHSPGASSRTMGAKLVLCQPITFAHKRAVKSSPAIPRLHSHMFSASSTVNSQHEDFFDGIP